MIQILDHVLLFINVLTLVEGLRSSEEVPQVQEVLAAAPLVAAVEAAS